MCFGTFSRQGAVALATIYPCAEYASSRSVYYRMKTKFLYDNKKKGHAAHPEMKSMSFFYSKKFISLFQRNLFLCALFCNCVHLSFDSSLVAKVMMTGYVEVIVKLVNKRNAGRDVQLCDFILRDVVQIFNQSTQRVAVSCDQNLLCQPACPSLMFSS